MSTTEEVLDALSAASLPATARGSGCCSPRTACSGPAPSSIRAPDAAADALGAAFGLLATADVVRVRRFQGEHAYAEFVLTGTTHDGQDVRAHYCDYVHVRDGKIPLKSTFHKATVWTSA